ncbi:MAG: hypothetical protein DHS20C15_26550 [Planctomycetota bacterium]|nr:MAG: hypothetical protein DHS20C15_26550 [Planctomycetota bacterium]
MLRARQKLDKYRITRRLGRGGFAEVYEAEDTVEGIQVALKVPHAHLVDKASLADFRREIRLTARLDHPNIVPIKSAGEVGGVFLIAQPLGLGTLHDRLKKRVSVRTALEWSQQLLEALAHAHGQRVIHCDVKPENLLIFPGNKLRLADFGIAKVAQGRISAAGTGTVGFIAPEQAMGRPSLRSDVFSAALVIWRLFSGKLPEWPYKQPLPGQEKVAALLPAFEQFLLKALSVHEEERHADCVKMLAAFQRLRPRLLAAQGRRTQKSRGTARRASGKRDWRLERRKQFQREFGAQLETRHACSRCEGPISEAMKSCPWCGHAPKRFSGETRFPASCPRCQRGVKLDWTYCAWCHGAAIGPLSARSYPDKRYAARCTHCRGDQLPFSRYCPWCRRKASKRWTLEGSRERCGGCKLGVAGDYWAYCPWCSKSRGAKPERSAHGR